MITRYQESGVTAPEAYKVYYSPDQRLLVAHEAGDLKYAAGHVHTNQTDGQLTPKGAVDLAVRTGASALFITDHDTVRPSLEARDYARTREYDLDVFPGAEISTADGHVLALGIDHDVLPRGGVDHTIRTIHDIGGVAIIPHMDLAHTPSVPSGTVERLLDRVDTSVRPDGIEVLNESAAKLHEMPLVGTVAFSRDTNKMAMTFHQEKFPEGTAFGGIDAHGRSFGTLTGYEGDSALDALGTGKTIVVYNPDEFGLRGQMRETRIMGGLFVKNKINERLPRRSSRS